MAERSGFTESTINRHQVPRCHRAGARRANGLLICLVQHGKHVEHLLSRHACLAKMRSDQCQKVGPKRYRPFGESGIIVPKRRGGMVQAFPHSSGPLARRWLHSRFGGRLLDGGLRSFIGGWLLGSRFGRRPARAAERVFERRHQIDDVGAARILAAVVGIDVERLALLFSLDELFQGIGIAIVKFGGVEFAGLLVDQRRGQVE